MYCLSQDTSYAGGRRRTTSNRKVVCNLPRRGRNAGSQPILSFLGLYPDCDVAKAWYSQIFGMGGFFRPRKGYEEQGDV
jgi:hypothetical protein